MTLTTALSPVDRVDADLRDLEDTWDDLLEHREPGTQHTQLRPPPSDDEMAEQERNDWRIRDELAARARERAEQGLDPDVGLGASPASARVDVIDAIAWIVSQLWTVEDAIRAAFTDSPAVRSHDGQPAPISECLRYLRAQLARVAAKHSDLFATLSSVARRTVTTSRRVRGLGEQTYRVPDPCPICGCMSLIAFPDRLPLVVRCVANPGPAGEGIDPTALVCECQLADCGCHRGHPHTWTHDPANGVEQWTWLAELLRDERRRRRDAA